MLLLLLILLPILSLIYLEVKHRKYKCAMNSIAGPRPLPIIGNAHQMGTNPHEILKNLFHFWRQSNCQSFRLWIGGYLAYVFLAEAEDMEHILSSTTMIEKSDVYHMLHPWIGQGILTSTGVHWHRHRKTITPSFHFSILQNYHTVMNKNSTTFINLLKQKSRGDNIFDFQKLAGYFTLDVICETAMGVSINAMQVNDSPVVKAFYDMCYNINMRAYHPLWRKNALYEYAPSYGKYKKTLGILQDFTNQVIRKRIEASKNQSQLLEAENDEYQRKQIAFLDTLLQTSDFSHEDIYDEVSTFMFAGHDTTTSAVSFSAFLLAQHPKIQLKVLEEQLQIMSTNASTEPSFQQISEMKYLDLFIKEVLRLYPSVPLVSRFADKDQYINGKFIPQNTVLNLTFILLNYNENYFEDPYRVDPLRFEANNDNNKPKAYSYLPFSAGSRNCIGQKFALLEVKTIISKLVRNFEILPALDELVSQDGYVRNFLGLTPEQQLKRIPNPSKYDLQLSTVLTLKSENGIHIRLRARI